MNIPVVIGENVPVSVNVPSAPVVPMTVRNGGDSTDYITHGELMAILANYVSKTELANEPTIVRWGTGEE